MVLELTPEQAAYKESVEAFARDVVAPRAAAIDETGDYPVDVMRAAGERGLLGVTIPKAWGGGGRDYVSYAVAIEAVARASATVAVALSVTNSLVAELIAHAGRAPQKEQWLRQLASGAAIGAFALSEPDAGTDAANQQSRAVKDGDGYRITGRKVWVANADAAAVAAEQGSAFTSLVPTMLGRLVAAGADLSVFRTILVGGAHLSPDLRADAERAGANVVETYGLTETCGGVVYDGVPLPGTEMRIDPEGGIELRGPTLMRGYRFDADAGEGAFTADGWLRPGDAGEIDHEGRLHVVGRFDDLINTGGEKVWPDEVEAALREHPGVRDVAAGARLDPEWGQRVAVWVVPADPADPPSLEELRAFAARTLPRYAAPRELTLAERLPRTPSGKLRRAALPRD
jgi:hypothetical protein